jgi:YidC/Oxa1 family membrane protein insertase
MEPFLWFENLAAPDALFTLPFVVPWFGWTHFNLLPCISIALMFIHQKLTMPKPTNEEQAQQQSMMNIMMVVMGATFYRVPSGLCLYFIATNVWSMTERWLFQHFKGFGGSRSAVKSSDPDSPAPVAAAPVVVKPGPEKPSALAELWNRLQQAADSQVTATRQLENSNSNRNDKKKKKR